MKNRLFYFLILLFCTSSISWPTYAQEDFLKIAPAQNNPFFDALLPHLMMELRTEYATLPHPFRRALWSLSQNKIDIAGPYRDSMINDYLQKSGIDPNSIVKLSPSIDRTAMFALYGKTPHTLNTPGVRIGYLKENQVHHALKNGNLLYADHLDQLAKLLIIGRIDVAVLPKSLMDQLLKDYNTYHFRPSIRPVYFEKSYLYLSKRIEPQANALKEAYARVRATPFYTTIWDKLSFEKNWQN